MPSSIPVRNITVENGAIRRQTAISYTILWKKVGFEVVKSAPFSELFWSAWLVGPMCQHFLEDRGGVPDLSCRLISIDNEYPPPTLR